MSELNHLFKWVPGIVEPLYALAIFFLPDCFLFWHLWLCLKTSPATIKRVWLRKAVLLWHVSAIDSLQRKLLGVCLLFPQCSPPPPPPPLPLLCLIFIKFIFWSVFGSQRSCDSSQWNVAAKWLQSIQLCNILSLMVWLNFHVLLVELIRWSRWR